MPIIDIIIAVALIVSIAIGYVRGFVKEAISIATLVLAIWASLYFGPAVGEFSESWLSSAEVQTWFGRVLVFAIVLSIGGLIGWGISKLVRLSVLSGLDRFMGSAFGALRGMLLVAICIIAGEFAGFDNDDWWENSRLLPHLDVVAEWIRDFAPKGYDLLIPDDVADDIPVSLPLET